MTKALICFFLCGAAAATAQYRGKGLIAHRGASAYAPENTLPAFELAIAQGAHYLENDLQVSKDGKLVVLHDTTLERTTDVATVFPDRFRPGQPAKRWYVYDFTLAEIRRLDAGAWKDAKYKGTRIPTFQELIDCARGRAGLYIETKGPETYDKLGFDMEKMVMDELRKNGLDRPGADPKTPVLIQSFSAASIRKMKQMGCRLPLQVLFGERDKAKWTSAEGIAELAKFSTGIGPEKSIVKADPAVVERAHKAGLTVAVWTFNAKGLSGHSEIRDEMKFFLQQLKVDAAITDNPDQFPR